MAEKNSNSKAARVGIFCREYVKDFNGTRAAKLAGYAGASAHVAASRLLKNPKVQAIISNLVNQRAKRQQMDGDAILAEIQKLALADIRKLLKPDGSVKPVNEWPDDVAKAIVGVKVREIKAPFTGEVIGYTKEFKTSDKLRALELLGKNLKLFTDKVLHEGHVDHTVAVVDYEQMKALHKKFNEEF